MSLQISIGKTFYSDLTGTDDSVTIGGQWSGVFIHSTVNCHITIDGSTATTNDFPIIAGERFEVNVDPGPEADGIGGGTVHFIKADGAADGAIWITEAS